MKGVSEIIAIILILMIVIALAALAYTWFSGTFSSLTGTASTSVSQTTGAMASSFKIEAAKNMSATNNSVTIRNTGTTAIDLTKMSAYMSETYSTVNAGAIGILTAGNTATLYVTLPVSVTLACSSTIMKLTSGTGFTDTKAVSC